MLRRMASNGPIRRMVRKGNAKVVVDKTGKQAVVHLPGLSTDDFNRVGRIGINRVLHWMTSARIAAYHIPNPETGKTFLEYDQMTEDRFTFMASSQTSVEPSFYEHVDLTTGFPNVDVELHLGYMGTSSLNSVGTLKERETEKVLARNVNQVVVIDRVTRTPTPIPDWWKQAYQNAVVENERLVVPQVTVPSEGTYRYNMTVTWNDTDTYKHTNYQSYVRFCLDAAMDAVDREFFAGFHGDILQYNVKSIRSLYAGESNARDVLIVDTWQDKDQPLRLLFSISRAEKIVFQSAIEFFEPITD